MQHNDRVRALESRSQKRNKMKPCDKRASTIVIAGKQRSIAGMIAMLEQLHQAYRNSPNVILVASEPRRAGHPFAEWHGEAFRQVDERRLNGESIHGACRAVFGEHELHPKWRVQQDSFSKTYLRYRRTDLPDQFIASITTGDIQNALDDLTLSSVVFQRKVIAKCLEL